MNKMDLRTIKKLLTLFRAIPTWTKEKHSIFNQVMKVVSTGEHIAFSTHVRQRLGDYKGDHCILILPQNKQGHLAVFAGQRCFVLCVGQGSYLNRYYVACPIR